MKRFTPVVRELRKIYATSRFSRWTAPQWLALGAAFTIFLIGMIIFAQIADEIHEGQTPWFDTAILQYVNSFASPTLDSVMVFLTDLGGVVGGTILVIGLISLFIARKQYTAAVQFSLGVIGALALNLLTKALFVRDRPDLWEHIVTETSYSFPSGHSMISAAIAVSLMILYWNSRWRTLVVTLAVGYMLVIGLTRIYLGVHYPTDVLGGWTLGASWVGLVAVIFSVRASRRAHRLLDT